MSLQNEIDKLKTLQESFNELSSKVLDTQAVLTELNHGKQEMVDSLAMKNVQSSTDKTLSAIAGDIRSIAQSPITIDGGEMYEKQLFGAATDKTNAYEQPDTPMWNLYQVMANLLSDGRFVTYGGIMLGEYPAGDDTIELYGAGAGGAYLTCDGVFYEIDKTGENAHVWNDSTEKSNRWVAYLFAGEYSNFNISTLEQCPLSIHIGRKVGTLSMSIAGRIREIIVLDGNSLNDINFASTQKFGYNSVIRNIKEHKSGIIYCTDNVLDSINCGVEKIHAPIISYSAHYSASEIRFPKLKEIRFTNKISSDLSLCYIFKKVFFDDLETIYWSASSGSSYCFIAGGRNAQDIKLLYAPKLKNIYIDGNSYEFRLVGGTSSQINIHLDALEGFTTTYVNQGIVSTNTKGNVYLPSIKSMSHMCGNGVFVIDYIHIGCKGTKAQTVKLAGNSLRSATNCFDIEIGDKEYIDKGLEPRWFPCQNININKFDAVTEENMINHILKRLKQDEEMCGSGVTITLGATNLAKLTSEEAVALLDSLTNTYGYTFA